MVTLAFATLAPEESFMKPEILPRSDCAEITPDPARMKQRRKKNLACEDNNADLRCSISDLPRRGLHQRSAKRCTTRAPRAAGGDPEAVTERVFRYRSGFGAAFR